MSIKIATEEYMKSFCEKTKLLKSAIDEADAVLIGAGAGLSVSAGFSYSGERFEKYFSDFREKYGFYDMYSGGFYPYETTEEYWAFWSRYILVNRYADPPKPIYQMLLKAVKEKNYFVLTTNVDHCFQKAGFDKKLLFYTQGDYGLFQCSGPCKAKTYDNEEIVRLMTDKQRNLKIPSKLVPKCPNCGKHMTMNLRCDEKFVEDEGWHTALKRYESFLRDNELKKILFLELGVGMNTPGIIKYPFWQMTLKNPKAVYACVNFKEAFCPEAIRERSICINADIGKVLSEIL